MYIKKSLNCVMCNKKYDDTFYDKGNQGRSNWGGTRYLCSKKCYSDWFDKWELRESLTLEQKKEQCRRVSEYNRKHKVKKGV